jgi:hypothetical protein
MLLIHSFKWNRKSENADIKKVYRVQGFKYPHLSFQKRIPLDAFKDRAWISQDKFHKFFISKVRQFPLTKSFQINFLPRGTALLSNPYGN